MECAGYVVCKGDNYASNSKLFPGISVLAEHCAFDGKWFALDRMGQNYQCDRRPRRQSSTQGNPNDQSPPQSHGFTLSLAGRIMQIPSQSSCSFRMYGVRTRNLEGKRLSRRDLLRYLSTLSLGIPAAGKFKFSIHPGNIASPLPLFSGSEDLICSAPLPPPTQLSSADDPLLEEMEKATFQYFWDQAQPQTGMVRDRFNVSASTGGVLGSIA